MRGRDRHRRLEPRLSRRAFLLAAGSALAGVRGVRVDTHICQLCAGEGLDGSLLGVLAWDDARRVLGLTRLRRPAPQRLPRRGAFDARGLTPAGFDLIAELESRFAVVDLARVGTHGVDDALAALTRPFAVSQTACRALEDGPLNLDDAQIRGVADRGGVIGLAVGPGFRSAEAFAAHAEHAVRIGGSAVVALGPRNAGQPGPAPLARALARRGWPPQALRGLLGGNVLRVLREVLA